MRLIQVKEGTTTLIVPDFSEYARKGSYDPSRATVFYNPKMEFSRDIGVMVLREITSKKSNLVICDPLAGVGARGIRYAKEVKGVNNCTINDLNKFAIPIIAQNVKINNLENIVKIECKDANLLLIEHSKHDERFDFIDLDPFGSPINFLDASIRAIKNEGVLAVTATDTAPLCGVYQKACFRKYGAISIKTEFCHEIGLRVLLGSIVQASIKHDFGIDVMLSYSVDHYFRAYVKLNLGARKADFSASLLGYVFYCEKCGWRDSALLNERIINECPNCSSEIRRAGPLWLGKIVNKEFLTSMSNQNTLEFNTHKRIEKLINLLIEESEMPVTYFLVDKICSRLKISPPPISSIIEKLKEAGFKASRTHFNPKGFKTDAPLDVVMKILRGQ